MAREAKEREERDEKERLEREEKEREDREKKEMLDRAAAKQRAREEEIGKIIKTLKSSLN